MNEITAARPPATFKTRRTWALDSTEGLGQLRGSLFEELTGREFINSSALDEIPEKMVLVVSELATNAQRHGKPPTIVTLMSNETEHLLDVADHDVKSSPQIARGREPGEGGFGLLLAQRLALHVGWYVTDQTKHIWARFPIDAEADSEQPAGRLVPRDDVHRDDDHRLDTAPLR